MRAPQPIPEFSFTGPWFAAREAQLYVTCKSIKSWHAWKRRHGIIARANGSVMKADLDRVLRRKKPRRVMHPNSLKNVRPPKRVAAVA